MSGIFQATFENLKLWKFVWGYISYNELKSPTYILIIQKSAENSL